MKVLKVKLYDLMIEEQQSKVIQTAEVKSELVIGQRR